MSEPRTKAPKRSDFLLDLDRSIAARRKLEAIAKGRDVKPLTADQAERILQYIGWLSKERDALFGCCDDD